MNDLVNQPTVYTSNLPPIEIALGINEYGKTTAKKLYEFLEMDKSQYARWRKNNISGNEFAEEGVDYEVYDSDVENPQGGRPTQDFKLTACFAKKLSIKEVLEMRGDEIEKAECNYKRLLSDTDVKCSRKKEERDNKRLLVSETTVMQNGKTARTETILERNGTII